MILNYYLASWNSRYSGFTLWTLEYWHYLIRPISEFTLQKYKQNTHLTCLHIVWFVKSWSMYSFFSSFYGKVQIFHVMIMTEYFFSFLLMDNSKLSIKTQMQWHEKMQKLVTDKWLFILLTLKFWKNGMQLTGSPGFPFSPGGPPVPGMPYKESYLCCVITSNTAYRKLLKYASAKYS